MSDGAAHPFPPPGAPAPAQPAGSAPPPPWPPVAPGAPVAPGMLGAAHKPGAFPLRPLGLGNIYDGAFRIIRFNPKATVGAAVMVTAAAMLVPIVITLVSTFTVGLALDTGGEIDPEASTAEIVGLLASYGSLLLAMVASQVGVILVTGMIAHVTRAAAVGRRLTLRQAWDATHGKRWRLIGLALLLGTIFTALLVLYLLASVVVVVAANDFVLVMVLWFVLSIPALVAVLLWLWIRLYYLPVPALMLEPIGVFAALGRGWRLTSRQFWRTLGIALLTSLIASFAGGLLSTPVSLGGQLGALAAPEYAALLLILTQAFALVIQNAFVAPFVATVTSVQYVDLRMRKEAFDVELMREAGIVAT